MPASAWDGYGSPAVIRLTQEQARRAGISPGRPHKYHAQSTTIDGIRFDSKKEAIRYGLLIYRQKIGEISDLKWQVRFPIYVTNLASGEITDCGAYVADFVYLDVPSGQRIVEDVKGGYATKTATYRLKKRLVEGLHGITIREV